MFISNSIHKENYFVNVSTMYSNQYNTYAPVGFNDILCTFASIANVKLQFIRQSDPTGEYFWLVSTFVLSQNYQMQ